MPKSFWVLCVKRVILDENLPVDLRLLLEEFLVVTVSYRGWGGIENGELLRLVDGEFDVFVTGDKKLRYQQNLGKRRVAIVELPNTRFGDIERYISAVRNAIRVAEPGSYTRV